jgi:hypothetical protein
MRPAETIPVMEEEGIKENDGGMNSSIICLIYYKELL